VPAVVAAAAAVEVVVLPVVGEDVVEVEGIPVGIHRMVLVGIDQVDPVSLQDLDLVAAAVVLVAVEHLLATDFVEVVDTAEAFLDKELFHEVVVVGHIEAEGSRLLAVGPVDALPWNNRAVDLEDRSQRVH
jgi:hypothetical protein